MQETGTPSDPLIDVPITPEHVEQHGLLAEEYEKIKALLGREPNWVELGVFSVMWSEHCSYKNSKLLLKALPKEKRNPSSFGKVLVEAGEENAGVIDIGDGWAVCFKIESHNHPSAIEPFEGAATGVGGIIRDIFTMGAKPILLTNSLRFGQLDNKQTRHLFRKVVAGISHYGNCIGIPNLGGDIYFDPSYEGNPLVNALCLGILKHDQIKRGKAQGIGNPVYYVGAPTGRDGLGGASFASKELSEESPEDRPAVQKGDPFMEKLLMEACLEIMAIPGLVVGIQDMGAAGLTCSICETAARASTGIKIDLDKVPAREEGMNAYEFLLSESQERMLVIVQKGRETEIEAIFHKWDLHAVPIGQVTEGQQMEIYAHGKRVVSIPAKALADESPLYQPKDREPHYIEWVQSWVPNALPNLTKSEITEALPKLLASPTIAHKQWVWQQYDHMVQTNTVLEPGSDAGVVRLRLASDKAKYLAIANDCNNFYCYVNPNRGAMIAVAECLRNLACTGAHPLGLTNNLNFGNPNNPEVFYQLKESVNGLATACRFFDLPVIGGNVSLYNEKEGQAIDPTPVVSVVGLIHDINHVTKQTVKGDEQLVLLGDWPNDIGASQFLKVIHDIKAGDAPKIDLQAEKNLHTFLLTQIEAGNISAAHDLSEGGLLVALAEMLFSKTTFGATITIADFDPSLRNDILLFGESQGRVIIALKEEVLAPVIREAEKHKVPAFVLGYVTQEPTLEVNLPPMKGSLQWSTCDLRKTWEQSIPQIMKENGLYE